MTVLLTRSPKRTRLSMPILVHTALSVIGSSLLGGTCSAETAMRLFDSTATADAFDPQTAHVDRVTPRSISPFVATYRAAPEIDATRLSRRQESLWPTWARCPDYGDGLTWHATYCADKENEAYTRKIKIVCKYEILPGASVPITRSFIESYCPEHTHCLPFDKTNYPLHLWNDEIGAGVPQIWCKPNGLFSYERYARFFRKKDRDRDDRDRKKGKQDLAARPIIYGMRNLGLKSAGSTPIPGYCQRLENGGAGNQDNDMLQCEVDLDLNTQDGDNTYDGTFAALLLDKRFNHVQTIDDIHAATQGGQELCTSHVLLDAHELDASIINYSKHTCMPAARHDFKNTEEVKLTFMAPLNFFATDHYLSWAVVGEPEKKG